MQIPMALVYKRKRKYKVGAIFFDLELSESHNFSNKVTQHAVEDGSIITDHIQNELYSGSVSGLISNFSINTPGIVSDRAQEAFDSLVELWRGRDLVDIVTYYRVYQGVVITNIGVRKTPEIGDSIEADFSFQEIQKVSLQELEITAKINIEDLGGDQNKQSSPPADMGKQAGVVR